MTVILRFGELELDEARFELRRGGSPVHLQPRVLELLLYLAAHRERVVTKQELFDRVWKSKFVSESTLTGAIAEARRALGGGEPQRSPIHTVHGRGYRFVAPDAQEVASEATGGGASVVVRGDPATAAAGPSPPSAPLTPVEPGMGAWTTGASRPPFLISAPAEVPPRARTPRRVPRLVALTALLLLLLGVAVTWRLRSPPTPASPLPAPVRLVLAPLAVSGTNPELRLAALSIQDLLSRRLEQVKGLVVDTPGGGLPRAQPASAAELRRLGGGRYLVTGTLRPSTAPGRARLSLVLYDFTAGGDPIPVRLATHDLPFLADAGDLSRFVVLREAITSRVVSRLLPAMAGSPGLGSAPRHPEAYRLYLQALEPLREAVCVGPTAINLLERSLALDPDFAPAWGELGWARYNSVSSCGESGDNYRLALEASARALRLDPTWPRALGLAAVVRAETGEAEAAYAALLAEERRSAASPADLPFFESYVLVYAGFLERSQKLVQEALRRDPTFLADGGWTPNAWAYRRDWDTFLELLPAGDSPLFRYYRGWGELQRGQRAAAREILAPAFVGAPNDLFARLAQALLAVVEERPEEARTLLREVALQRRSTGARDGEVTFKMAQLFALAGEPRAASEQAARAIEQGFFCPPCFRNDPLLAPLAGEPELARRLEAAEARHVAFGRRFGLPR